MSPILEVIDLVKDYGKFRAVNGLSFSIPSGICFGLLGPNGAGKTSTIEIIEGIKKPTGGTILFNGAPRDKHFATQAGIQFQSTALMDYLTVRENLELFKGFYPKTVPIDELVERCDLSEFLDHNATKLSGGQHQRLLLALALINDPQIIFLDEPTTGLDPQSRRRFWQLIEEIKREGKTVVLTTHYMDEAEYLCDHLIIVDHGQIIAEGSPQELLDEHFGHVSVRIPHKDYLHIDKDFPEPYDIHNSHIEIYSHAVEATIALLLERGIPLTSLQVHNPTLEDVFLKLTGHSLRE